MTPDRERSSPTAAPPNYWYPVLESRQLRRKPVALRRFGEPLVAWRAADGAPVLMPDRCPHRGMALACGRVVAGELECPWHGLRFGATGACTRVPCSGARARIPRVLNLAPRPVREQHGLVWTWRGERREHLPEVPWFAELPDDLRGSAAFACNLPFAWDRMMESNIDLHHLPFLHRRSIPGVGPLLDPYEVTVEGELVRSWGRMRKDDGSSIVASPGFEFEVIVRLPTSLLFRFGGKLALVLTITPIDDENTWYFFRYYHQYTRFPLAHRLIAWLATTYDRLVVQPEDWRHWAALRERRFDRRSFHLLPADRAIVEYFRLVERECEKPTIAATSA